MSGNDPSTESAGRSTPEGAYREELQQLKGDIGKLQSDIAEITGMLRPAPARKSLDIKGKVHKAEQAYNELVDRINDGIDHGKRTIGEVEEHISGHPTSTLIITFSVGYMLAKLMDLGKGHGSKSG